MIRALSAAASALSVAQTRTAVTAHNVANALTPGFRRAARHPVESPGGGVQTGAITQDLAPATILSLGEAPGPVAPGQADPAGDTLERIVALAAYRANVKTLRTSDSMLQATLNLRRPT